MKFKILYGERWAVVHATLAETLPKFDREEMYRIRGPVLRRARERMGAPADAELAYESGGSTWIPHNHYPDERGPAVVLMRKDPK